MKEGYICPNLLLAAPIGSLPLFLFVYIPLIAGFAYMILKYAGKCSNRLKAFSGRLKPWQAAIIFTAAVSARFLAIFVLRCDYSRHCDYNATSDLLTQLFDKGFIYTNFSYAVRYVRYFNVALLCYPWARIFGSSIPTPACRFMSTGCNRSFF